MADWGGMQETGEPRQHIEELMNMAAAELTLMASPAEFASALMLTNIPVAFVNRSAAL